MRAVKLGLYCLAGLIASSTVSRLAAEVEAVQVIIYGGLFVWMYSVTNFGHEVSKRIFRLDDAETGTLRFLVAIVFLSGVFINWSFEGFPLWLQTIF